MDEPIIDLCPVCGRTHVTSTEGAACDDCDPSAQAKLLVRAACPKCDGAGAREGEPWCVRCDGDGQICRPPTTADLLTDPRVRALVEAVEQLQDWPDQYPRHYGWLMKALAPFEEVSRGK